MGEATWLEDDSGTAARSSALVMILMMASAAVFGSVLYALADKYDRDRYQTRVSYIC